MSEPPFGQLSDYDRNAFLRRGLIARLACLDDVGHPYIVPVWHLWDGERFWLVASERARWAGFLQSRPHVALSIDDPESIVRVHCQGMARYVEGPSTDGKWVGIALQMASRYLGKEGIPAYQQNTAGLRRWLFAIDVLTMTSWAGASRTD